MPNPGTGPTALDLARKKALQLLRIKLRSTAELRDRLATAGFSQHTIDAVVGELTKAKVLNDAALAEAHVRRIKDRGPADAKAVQAALARRGLTPHQPPKQLGSSRDEILAFAKHKLASMPPTLTVQARATRLASLLARRGFEQDFAEEIVAALTGLQRDDP